MQRVRSALHEDKSIHVSNCISDLHSKPHFEGSGVTIRYNAETILRLTALVMLYEPSLLCSKTSVAYPSRTSGLNVGKNARKAYTELKLFHGAKYPPVALSFYPGFDHLTFFLVMLWLVFTTGWIVRGIFGKSLFSQMREMVHLWYREKIDPPSYYSQRLYLASRMSETAHYLTRFETKNGLFRALNTLIPSPHAESEINNKELFAEICRDLDIPHARTLLSINKGEATWHCDTPDLEQDIFCKRRRGVGAQGVIGFRLGENGCYIDYEGHRFTLEDLLASLSKLSFDHPIIVQPRLNNHKSIADLADESLIAIRVVTCIDELGDVEVTHGMLRILPELEPKWRDIADEELAAPIDLVTGALGPLSGDKMFTTHIRHSQHPVTRVAVEGRILEDWSSICDLAIKTHSAFPHRMFIGWDIALTPEGPVVLEGNTNFDVMLLQRVHDQAIGRTRLGALMNFHMKALPGYNGIP
jgi:Sugar-transfer associated ATP-grasp